MSKLEEKLSASIKGKQGRPQTGEPASEKSPGAATQAPKARAGGSKVTDLNSPVQPLHPSRIWPD